jgi:predicted GNAT family acetyltransferase
MSAEITVADNPEDRRYEIFVDGARAGFATYRLSPGLIAFIHTEIDPALERQGLGTRLVRAALDDARSRGLAVRPVCPFVVDFVERNPEYADLVK